MIAELNVDGVLLSSALVSAVIALVLMIIFRQLLLRFDLYRWVWNPALIDISIFVILWAAVLWLPAFRTVG